MFHVAFMFVHGRIVGLYEVFRKAKSALGRTKNSHNPPAGPWSDVGQSK